jgi:predicted RNase H-like nuclease (RuvC/YqgF family)
MEAEERLQEVTAELEDLSASLFQSANEMVAEERRARSKLEQRVAILEKRDVEKKERLGVLERAVDRISRVREMLTGGSGTAVP